MLTLSDIQKRLSEVKYKDWNITASLGDFEGVHLNINGTVEDAFNPGKTMTLDIHSPVPMPIIKTVKDFDLYLAWRLCIVASHEAREFLQVKENDTPLFNPHADGADRDVADLQYVH